MLDVNLIRQNPDLVKAGIAKKSVDPKLVDAFLRLDEEWRSKVSGIDSLRSEQKMVSLELAKRKAPDLIARAQILKDQLQKLEKERERIEPKRKEMLDLLPNLPFEEVPAGKNDKENKVIKEVGEKPNFSFVPKDYLTLAEKMNVIDVKRAAKVSGSRFGYLLGEAALLEQALAAFALRHLTDEKFIAAIITKNKLKLKPSPFIPVIPPVLISNDSMWAMGYLERGTEEIYHLPKDNLYLVGTSEQSIGPLHKDETFKLEELPKRYLGISTCFRREAGSYGRDTKGILRVHQFNKAEMFSFVAPETSRDEHQLIVAIEEHLMQKLQIPYRLVEICTGDLGDSAAKKFDIESWMPGQNDGKGEYRETHSASNTTDFQARRLNIKCETRGKNETSLVHLLNGTAFAFGRVIISILENCQTAEGGIRAPKALEKYLKAYGPNRFSV